MTRSKSARRSNYYDYAPQEEFIVPLLKKHINQVLINYLKPTGANYRVLDVGCGGQPFRKQLEELGYSYTGMDVTQNLEESVEIISEIDKHLSDKLTEIGCFDLIFCTEVMEHVADWDIAFSNFYQLLGRNGKLFITCPSFYQLHEIPYDFWRPTPYALMHFAEKYGFHILLQENAGDAWDILGTLLANVYSIPLRRTFQDRILNRLVNLCKQIIFKLLKNRYLQNHVELRSTLYMSNIMLCQKR